MQKYFETFGKNKGKSVSGKRFGNLVVVGEPYYVEPPDSGKHRRKKIDCLCDCGNTREGLSVRCLHNGAYLPYCGRECPFYIEAVPKEVPQDSKLCFLGEKYNYLTVVKEAYYDKQKGDSNRAKYIDLVCDCGKTKSYREDKVKAGKYKSCGCVWEYTGKNGKDWGHLQRTYGMSEEDYNRLLETQNGLCGICKTDQSWNNKSKHFFVDHCHDTGKIRGLLCDRCNRGLGYFKDDKEALAAAIKYLEVSSED